MHEMITPTRARWRRGVIAAGLVGLGLVVTANVEALAQSPGLGAAVGVLALRL